ncbi:type II toxin-antitoxin system VapC family toxin [Nitratifractor sp.]
MKILLDTNVVLDLLLEREPFVQNAREIFVRIEKGEIEGFLGATTVTIIHYLVSKNFGSKHADLIVADLLRLFDITRIDRDVLLAAIQAKGIDYEDSVLYTSALFAGMDTIVTRDKKGFVRSTVPVLQPNEFLKRLTAP